MACVNELIKRAIEHPGSRNWYVTNDYKQAKRNVWDLFAQFIPKELGCTFNNSELKITFQNGSKIELIGVENAEALRGAAVHFMVLDEYDDFPTHVFPVILEPMLTTTAGGVWFVGTPKGFKNLYSLYASKDPELTKHRIPACTLSLDGRTVTETLSPYAKKEVIQRALNQAWEQGTVDVFQQEYLADFHKPEGAVYKGWNLDHFREVDYNMNLPLHVSFDWGVNDPTAIIWIQVTGKEIRVIDYYEVRDSNIDHIVSVIRGKPYKWPDLFCGDPAGKARTLTTGTSPIEMLAAKGIFVSTRDGVDIPSQIRAAQSYIPHLFVDINRAERFRDILVNYAYPKKETNVLNQSNEKPIHDEWSHGARAFEYWAVNYKNYAVAQNPTVVRYEQGFGGSQIPIYDF